MSGEADGGWLGAAQVTLTAGDVADGLALAMAARVRLPDGWGWRPRMAAGAALCLAASLAFWRLPADVAAGIASMCVMAGVVALGRIPHGLLVVMMSPAAWMTVRQHAGSMNAFVAWGRTGLHAEGQGSNVITLWSEMRNWGERRCLVLHKPAAGYIIIPKRCLTDMQADAIRSALREAGVPLFGQPDLRAGAVHAAPALGLPGPRSAIFRLTVAELVAARRYVVMRGVLTPTTGLGAALAVGVAWWAGWLVVPGNGGETVMRAVGIGLASAAGFRLVLPLLLTRWAVERHYRVQRGVNQDCQIEWDDDGFHATYANGDVRKAWTEVRHWYLADRFVFLSLGPNLGQTIPRRALDPAQLADLQACAAAAGVRGAGR